MSRRARLGCVWALGVAATVAVLLAPPFAQDPAYHQFADQRRLLGIPHFFDVVSNAGFLLVGLLSLRAFPLLGASLIGTAAGSAYYHLWPNDATLFWDRLPIAVVCMAVLAVVIGDRIGDRAGRLVRLPLVAAGAAGAIHWRVTGDLRFYVLVQFFPIPALLLLMALFPAGSISGSRLGGLLGWYGVARVAELWDHRIFELAGGWVGGHTLKHLAAALALWWFTSPAGTPPDPKKP